MKQRDSRDEIVPVKSRKRSFKSQVRLKKRSKNLTDLIRQEEDLFREEIQELYQLFSIYEDSQEEETLQTSSLISSTAAVAPPESSKSDKLGSSESLSWDTQVDIHSPLKDTSDLLDTSFSYSDIDSCPPALSRERSVSVSVNRASYEPNEPGTELDLHPVCRNLNRQFLNSDSSESPDLINQDSILERNLVLRQRDVLLLVGEETEVNLAQLSEEENLEVEGAINKMDITEYETKLKAVKSSMRRAEDKILGYGPDDVTAADQDEYKKHLDKIRVVYEKFMELANSLIDDLDDTKVDDEQRVIIVNQLKVDMRNKLKKNEIDVKNKVVEVIAAYEADKPLSAADKKTESLKVEKVMKRMGFIKEKANDAKTKILKVKSVNDMNDIEVRENMLESKNWESLVKEIVHHKEKAEEDAVGIDIDPQVTLDLQGVVQSAVDALTNKLDNLKLEDRKRGLYSIVNRRTVKDSVIFPDAFEGKNGENVYKFKQKFEEAIADAQVCEKDKVEVLRKHLVGEAKS